MKALTFIIAATVASSSAFSAATVEVASEGHVQSLPESRRGLVQFWLQELMLSALHRDVVQNSSPQEWRRIVHSRSRIDCRYTATVTLAIPERPEIHFDEVLLPLPPDHYPDYIYVKRGQQFFRLAMYDPWVLHRLTLESGFALYPGLRTVERGLF